MPDRFIALTEATYEKIQIMWNWIQTFRGQGVYNNGRSCTILPPQTEVAGVPGARGKSKLPTGQYEGQVYQVRAQNAPGFDWVKAVAVL